MYRYYLIVTCLLALALGGFARARTGVWEGLAPEPAVPGAQNRADTLETLRVAGFDALYNLDYAAAGAKFDAMIQFDPAHPAGYFYLATSRWLSILKSMRRLQIGLYTDDAFFAGSFDKVESALELEFTQAVDKALTVAQARVKARPNDVIGLYYQGAAFGLRASYEASVKRNFRPAIRFGERGVELHRKVAKLDPNFADAYLSLGLYDYIAGKLPWLARWGLKFVGKSGNRQLGLTELRKAMEQGKYVNDDARTVLVAVYQREGNYSEALKLLDELTLKYPRNYLFSLERAAGLGQLGKCAESYSAFEQVLKDEAAQTIADLIHYRYGEALLDGGEFKRAAEQFVAVTETPKADEALVSLAHLRHGQALDAAGERSTAKTQYQLVLQRENAFDSRSLARKYLDKPFVSEKPRQQKCAD